jgi:hypothetical protein
MPEASTSFWPNALAGVGYLLTFCACLIGVPIVLIALAVAIGLDLGRGVATGTFRERLRKPRW